MERIGKRIEKSDALKQKLYTITEQQYCEKGKVTMFQCYAARFAAKEAFLKALGTGYRYGMAFHEIEILNDELGKPYVNPLGKVKAFLEENKIQTIHLSISHIKETAVAMVVMEK